MKIKDIIWGFEHDALVFSHEDYEASIQADIRGDVMAYASGREAPFEPDSPRNRFWVVENGTFYAEGTTSTESESKAAAMVAAWCHANGAVLDRKVRYHHLNWDGAWVCFEGLDVGYEWGLFQDGLDMALISGESPTLSEAQLAAIMAYEDWREKGGGNG